MKHSKHKALPSSSHLPLSSINCYAKHLSPHHKSIIYQQSCTKSLRNNDNKKINSSPYIYLPSVTKDYTNNNHKNNNQNINFSNVSSQNQQSSLNVLNYCSEKQQKMTNNNHNNNNSSSNVSIYEKFRLDSCYNDDSCSSKKGFDTQYQQQLRSFTKRKQNVIYSQEQANHQSRSQSKCHHKSPINFTKKSQQKPPQQYFSLNYSNQQSIDRENRYTFSSVKNKSQSLMKSQINDKLDRVCEKIENLSREKDRSENNHKSNHQYQQFNYSVKKIIVRSGQQNRLHQPSQNHHDNQIQHKILSPSPPTHQQFLQSYIIQLNKKITLFNCRIVKLQQQLLSQREKLIKKEKQWLLRENQLLWQIQENQLLEGEDVVGGGQSQKIDRRQNITKTKNNNIIVNDNNCSKNVLKVEEQLQKCNKNIIDGFSQLVNKVMAMLKINFSWMELMNRTLSHQLPGTAFRVKEEMNLNFKYFKDIQKLCQEKISILQQNAISTKFSISPIQSPPTIANSSTNPSQVFLLDSYCPPVSQHYQIQTTKRATSITKPSQNQPKSLSCLSESKSTTSTSKKNNISTHKKSVKKNNKHIKEAKLQQKVNKSLYESRKSQYYCDQVFYSRAREELSSQQQGNNYVNKLLPDQNLLFDNDNNSDLYYMLSLQAIAIETLIPRQQVENSTPINEPEENLLLDMDV